MLAAPKACTSNAPGPRKLWRLTAAEFAASIRSIFNDTSNAAPVATVFSDPSVLGFSVDANALLVQGLNASQLQDNAEAIAAWAASSNKLASFAGCASSTSGAPASSCATSFIQAFGRLAFRTTLAASDPRIATYSKLFMAGTSNADGAQAVISAMLQSPYFLYRSELGAQSGGTFKLTPYEVATELAYTLTGTTPDATLLSAADSVAMGSLSLSAMVDQQASRLLASGSASNAVAVMGFMDGWLGLSRLYTTAHDATVYQLSPALQNDMWNESQSLILEAFNGNGTFGSLLTADHSFLNQELAAFYGINASGLGTLVHQREVRRADDARPRPAGDGHDPERLRAPRHGLADAAWSPHSIAAAVPEHRQPAAGPEHDVHALEHAGDDPAALHQRARARHLRQLPQADGLDRVRVRELRRLGALPDHRQRVPDGRQRDDLRRPGGAGRRRHTAFRGRAAWPTCWPRATT